MTGNVLERSKEQENEQEFAFGTIDRTLTVHRLRLGRSRRKCTSVGVVSTNVEVTKHWRSTQRLEALPASDAELYATNKGAAEAMSIKSQAADMGISFSIVLKTEAAAALGVVNRRGIGKMRNSVRKSCECE